MTSVTKPVTMQSSPSMFKAMKAPRKLPEMSKRVMRSHEMNQQFLAKEKNRNDFHQAVSMMASIKIKTEPEEDCRKPVDFPEPIEEQSKGKQPFNSPFLNVESIACAGEQNKFYTATLKLDEVLVVACASLRTLMRVTTLISHNIESEVIKIETCEKEAIGRSSNAESFSSSPTNSFNRSLDGQRKYSTHELVKLASHTLCQRYPADWNTIAEKFPEIVSKEPQYFNPSDYEGVQFTDLFKKPFGSNQTVNSEGYRPATISDTLEDRRYIPVNNPNLKSMSETRDVRVPPATTNKSPPRRLPHPSTLSSLPSSCNASLSNQTNIINMSGSNTERWPHDRYSEGNMTRKVATVVSESEPQRMNERPMETNHPYGSVASDKNLRQSQEQQWPHDKFVEKKPKTTPNFEYQAPHSRGPFQGNATSISVEKSADTSSIGSVYQSPRSKRLLQETVASKLELYNTIAESRNKISHNDSSGSDKLSRTVYPPPTDGLVNQPNFYGGQFMRINTGRSQMAGNVNNNNREDLWLDESDDMSNLSIDDRVSSSARDFAPREYYNRFITEDITEYGLVNDPLRSIDTNRYM